MAVGDTVLLAPIGLGAGNTGAPACTSECELDLSVCESSCGNGMLDDDEGCDGDLFRGAQSCDQAMLGSGPLACKQCVTDLSVCPMRGSCGNGTREEWEAWTACRSTRSAVRRAARTSA